LAVSGDTRKPHRPQKVVLKKRQGKSYESAVGRGSGGRVGASAGTSGAQRALYMAKESAPTHPDTASSNSLSGSLGALGGGVGRVGLSGGLGGGGGGLWGLGGGGGGGGFYLSSSPSSSSWGVNKKGNLRRKKSHKQSLNNLEDF